MNRRVLWFGSALALLLAACWVINERWEENDRQSVAEKMQAERERLAAESERRKKEEDGKRLSAIDVDVLEIEDPFVPMKNGELPPGDYGSGKLPFAIRQIQGVR